MYNLSFYLIANKLPYIPFRTSVLLFIDLFIIRVINNIVSHNIVKKKKKVDITFHQIYFENVFIFDNERKCSVYKP